MDPPIDRPGVDILIVYIVVADDLAVRGSTSDISSIVNDGLGDLDRSLVMAEPGVAIVSPGDHFHSGIVAGVAVGEEIQELGDTFELRDRVRGRERGVMMEGE